MKKLLLIIAMILPLTSFSQLPDYLSGYSFGGPGDEYLADMTLHNGKVYLLGTFSDSMDVNAGSGTHWLYSNGGKDIFLAVYDDAGGFIDAISLGANSNDLAYAVELDAAGNIYISCSVDHDTVDVDPNPLALSNVIGLAIDPWIAKYNAALQLQSVMHMAGSSGNAQFEDLVVDTAGSVYLSGSYNGNFDLDPGAGTAVFNNGGINLDGLVAKYDSNFSFLWAFDLTSYGYNSARSLSWDAAGYVNVTGYFQQTVDFNPSGAAADTFNLRANGFGMEFFLARYSAQNGSLVWAFSWGDANDDLGFEVRTCPNGNIAVVGAYSDSVDFDPGNGTQWHAGAGDRDAFLAGYTAAGNFVFQADTGGISLDNAYGVAVDPQGDIYYTGYKGSGMFTGRFSASGTPKWMMMQSGGTQYISGDRVQVDGSNHLYLASIFNGTFTPTYGNWGPDDLSPSGGGFDVFVMKYDLNPQVSLTPEARAGLKLYPNPSREAITVEWGDIHPDQIQVLSMNGVLLAEYRVSPGADNVRISTQTLPAGMYLITASGENGKRTGKFVVE